jgi:hypothetical protein
MVKGPSKSILDLKCFKKIMLIFGFSSFLLILGTVSLLAGSILNVSYSDGQQQIKVSGRVVDSSNNPLAGVNVIEKGTSNGAITGADGTYVLTVASDKSTLSFSFIGYDVKDVVVGKQTAVNLTLTESTTGLNEVVVVGYGTQRKEAVTGSVASVKGDIVRQVPSANISQAMQGRVAGVDMEQTSTKPGSVMQVHIRGTRSLNAATTRL